MCNCNPRLAVTVVLFAVLAIGCNKYELRDQSLTKPPDFLPAKTDQTSGIVQHLDAFQGKEACKLLGSWQIDRSAYIGFQKSFADLASAYIERALSALPLNAKLNRPVYKRIELPGGPRYPLDVGWEAAGMEPVPVLVLPSPSQIRAIIDLSKIDKYQIAKVLGRTILFDPGWTSTNPWHIPPMPIGFSLPNGIFKYKPPHLELGKIVLSSNDVDDLDGELLSPLRIDRIGGATLLAWLRTMPITPGNPILRVAQLEQPGRPATEWIAYSFADANGASRPRSLMHRKGESRFSKQLQSSIHDPLLDQFSLLRLPMPLSLRQKDLKREAPCEEFALDEWFAQADPPIFALTLDPSSTPFRESFVLRQVKAGAPSKEPIWLLIVFSNIDPRQLLEALKSVTQSNDWHPENESKLIEELQQLRERALNSR